MGWDQALPARQSQKASPGGQAEVPSDRCFLASVSRYVRVLNSAVALQKKIAPGVPCWRLTSPAFCCMLEGEGSMNRSFSSVAFLILLVLISTASPSSASLAVDEGPAMGVHTIRADDNLLQLADSGGFTWLIQLLEWREVEPAPGESFWEYPDWLVRAAEYYSLDLALRLDHPPEWALSGEKDRSINVAAYARFVERVAARYRGRVMAYVVWNEPNLAIEWDGQPPDPEGYVQLLCAAQAAIQRADPNALVITAGLAPTNHADASALDDRIYLRAMYNSGAGTCFDALGTHPYGFAYPPSDPHGAHNSLNFARLADLRAIMVLAGDGDKPAWATEVGWTTEPAGPDQRWLQVSEEEQGRYLGRALQKAGSEWPWLERIAIWNLSTGLPAGDEKRGYSLLANTGRPKPAFEALAAVAREHRNGRADEQGDERVDGRTAEVLAPDVVIRLSDVDTFYPHWARPHCSSVPCRHWSGEFYVRDPGTAPWQLHLEIMQVEEPGNLVWINGRTLGSPAIPLRGRPDFASVWTAAEIAVPACLLRSGMNVIEIGSCPRLPVYQDDRARYESLQFRHVRLESQFSEHP